MPIAFPFNWLQPISAFNKEFFAHVHFNEEKHPNDLEAVLKASQGIFFTCSLMTKIIETMFQSILPIASKLIYQYKDVGLGSSLITSSSRLREHHRPSPFHHVMWTQTQTLHGTL